MQILLTPVCVTHRKLWSGDNGKKSQKTRRAQRRSSTFVRPLLATIKLSILCPFSSQNYYSSSSSLLTPDPTSYQPFTLHQATTTPNMHISSALLLLASLSMTVTATPLASPNMEDAVLEDLNLDKRACGTHTEKWQGGGCETGWEQKCYSKCNDKFNSKKCCAGSLVSAIRAGGCFPGWSTCECSCWAK